MATAATQQPMLRLEGFETLETKWNHLFIIGIAMSILGIVAILLAGFSTLATVVVLGALVAAGGVAQMAHALSSRGWGGVLLHLLIGILYAVAGVIMMTKPILSAVSLTLFLGIFFLATGAMRAVMAIVTRYPSWGWTLFSGIVTLGLGLIVLAGLPAAGLVTIGIFVGVDLLMGGAALTSLALAAHRPASNQKIA